MQKALRLVLFLFATMNGSIAAMNLHDMPREIIGQIMATIARDIGTHELINKADIPVIVKYTKALSLTNRALYYKVNDVEATRMLVTAIAHRFAMDECTAVGLIKTPGAWEWIKKYLEMSGEYEQFKVMQRIFEIAHEVRTEFKGLGFAISDGQESRLCSNSSQTKQGFFLLLESTPARLATPWGDVRLFSGGSGYGYLFKAFTQDFMKRFKVAFVAPPRQRRNAVWQDSYYETTADDLKALIRSGKKIAMSITKLTEDEVQQRDGTEKIIFHGLWGHYTTYKLLEVDGNPLPEPKMRESTDYRSHETTDMIWKILEDRYHKEKGIIKQKDETKITQSSLPHEVKQKPTYRFDSLAQVAQRAIKVLEQIDSQPLFDGSGSTVEKCKVLPLEDWGECRIIDTLCSIASHKLGDTREWNIRIFGERGFDQLYDAHGKNLKQGLHLWIHEESMQTRCSLTELKSEFDTYLNQMSSGWSLSTLAQHPDIFHRESEEEWFLLIKPQSFIQENFLIESLAAPMDLDTAISCERYYWSEQGDGEHRDQLYLWIRKKDFDRVVRTLELKINNLEAQNRNSIPEPVGICE